MIGCGVVQMSRDSSNQGSTSIPSFPGASVSSYALNGVPSPRRRFPRVAASRCPAPIPEHPDEELWVDGPRSSVCFEPAVESAAHTHTGYSDKFSNHTSSAIFGAKSASSSELWVDGPVAFQTKLQDSVSHSRTVDNLAAAAVARKPVINSNVEQSVTSSRPSRKSSYGEGAVSYTHLTLPTKRIV